MARKSPQPAAPATAKAAKRRAGKRPAKTAAAPSTRGASAAAAMPGMPDLREMGKMAKLLTPEQAIELYKANAKIALDIVNAAIDNTARLRKKQFEGEEEVRAFQKKHTRSVGEARDAQSLMVASQGAAQEALEKSMHYWGEMFDLIVEMQKRLFTLIEDQMAGVPGVKEARAAMALMPDLTQMQKVVSAMQGVVTSGGSAFESMQRVMGDFAKMAETSMSGMCR
jgi:hypothetical protein